MSALTNGRLSLIKSVVGKANERAGFDVLEAHGFTEDLIFGKFVGMNVSHDREMLSRGLQILPEREDVRALSGEVVQSGEHFVFFFAEAEHQARLGWYLGMRFFRTAEQLQRPLVHGAFTHLAIEARHRFRVVVENVWPQS